MKKILLLFGLIIFVGSAYGQNFTDKNLKKYNGFFNFYYEEDTDKIYLEVTSLNQEFLYVNSLASGVGSNDIGLDRGQLGQDRVVKFQKAGNKLLLVQPNQSYRAITDNAEEKRSIEEAFAKSVLYGFPIVEDKNGSYIIDLTPMLLEDAHGVSTRLKQRKQGSYKLDKGKSALHLERTKAFPLNVEFEALLTFVGEPKGNFIRSVVPTASNVSVHQHHSFIELPDDNYQPREFDPRSGAIFISYMDYSTPVYEPIRKRYAIRHRLEKKDKDADKSEAIEPIVYYLDPGTPEPIRSALLDGAEWWNEAFEEIGYKDGFQVKMLPKDADPLDCRYNVIQWVHRSTRGWSYGASVVDPRTGEIIKGHVSLGSLRIRQDFMIAQALTDEPFSKRDDNYEPMLELALARIRQLSAHEVGHTIGFAHNFAASAKDRASVMDYPHPNIELKGNKIDYDDAYDVGIGEWDKVTVAYSYSEFKSAEEETEGLNKILSDAQKDGHRFITDSDARAQGGAHGLAHLWDNGENAAEELNRVMKVRKTAISNFSDNNIRTNDTYTELEDVFVPLYFFHRYQTEATVKIIGGLNYNYAVKGDEQVVTEALSAKMQKEALDAVLGTLSAKNLAVPKSLLELFPPRAFGYNRTRESFKGKTGVAFDPLSAASTASDLTLSLLLNPERANRLVLQKSLDNNQIGFKDMLNRLLGATLARTSKNSYLNEVQVMINDNVLKYVMNLAVSDKAYPQVRLMANQALREIMKNSSSSDTYADYYKMKISKFLEKPEDFKKLPAPKIPDGSPIGSDLCSFGSRD